MSLWGTINAVPFFGKSLCYVDELIESEICHRLLVDFLFRFYRYIGDGQTILMRLLAKQMKFFVLQEGHLAANAKATGSAWALR